MFHCTTKYCRDKKERKTNNNRNVCVLRHDRWKNLFPNPTRELARGAQLSYQAPAPPRESCARVRYTNCYDESSARDEKDYSKNRHFRNLQTPYSSSYSSLMTTVVCCSFLVSASSHTWSFSWIAQNTARLNTNRETRPYSPTIIRYR